LTNTGRLLASEGSLGSRQSLLSVSFTSKGGDDCVDKSDVDGTVVVVVPREGVVDVLDSFVLRPESPANCRPSVGGSEGWR